MRLQTDTQFWTETKLRNNLTQKISKTFRDSIALNMIKRIKTDLEI